MRPYFWLASLIIGFLLFIPLHSESQGTQKSIIRVKGAYSMSSQMDKLAKKYMQGHPNCNIVVTGGGTPLGIAAFLNGEADMAMSSYEIDDESKKMANAKKLSLDNRFIGWDGLAIICNPKNPANQLTLEQVKKLFLNDYTTWDEIGGDYYGIVAYVPDPEKSGVAIYFNKILGERPRSANIRHAASAIVREVSNREDAVGYATLGQVQETKGQNKIKVLGIQRDEKSPPIVPTKQTIKDESYLLRKPMLLYFNKDSKDPTLAAFADFCLQNWDE